MPARRSLRVVVVAEESAGVQALEALLAAPESPELVAVATSTEPRGTRRPLVAAAAARHGLEIVPESELRGDAFRAMLREREVDLLVNVHSLHVLEADTVQAPSIGSFNLHPGPLPEYAGLNAPSWAIYEGKTSHAVTLHWMEAGIDTGPVAYSASFPVDEEETGLSLTAKCVRHGVPLLSRLVADAARDPAAIPARAQDPRRRRYFGREVPNGGRVRWSASAREIVRFVRAADYAPFESPWGTPQARLGGRAVGVAKASLTGEAADEPPGVVGRALEGGAVTVAAADEWVAVRRAWRDRRALPAVEVCPPGERFDPDA